jgi:hypothetical protein
MKLIALSRPHWMIAIAPSFHLLNNTTLDDISTLDSGRRNYWHLADGTVDARGARQKAAAQRLAWSMPVV